MVRLLSRTFHSLKSPNPNPNPLKSSSSTPSKQRISLPKLSFRSWCVYLILSTNVPIKTYVGVTTDFPRRYVLYVFGTICSLSRDGLINLLKILIWVNLNLVEMGWYFFVCDITLRLVRRVCIFFFFLSSFVIWLRPMSKLILT